jgi:hypothetical protein
MMPELDATLHIRLDARSLQTLKQRARARSLPLASYAAMILRYLTLLKDPTESINPSTPPDSEDLYVSAALPGSLRARLIVHSGRSRSSLASFAGSWIVQFLDQYARDPMDLAMMCHLGELLDRKGLLSDQDLEAVVRLAADTSVSRMPAAYQVKWYHARMKPLIQQVSWQGQESAFTPEQVAALLARISR